MARIDGDDGLLADDVGEWATEKHSYLKRYVEISSAARKKYIGPSKGGAVYFDLFRATGRSRIRNSGDWIDGSAVAAWKDAP
jgi:three-Cys-motif partner protein